MKQLHPGSMEKYGRIGKSEMLLSWLSKIFSFFFANPLDKTVYTVYTVYSMYGIYHVKRGIPNGIMDRQPQRRTHL